MFSLVLITSGEPQRIAVGVISFNFQSNARQKFSTTSFVPPFSRAHTLAHARAHRGKEEGPKGVSASVEDGGILYLALCWPPRLCAPSVNTRGAEIEILPQSKTNLLSIEFSENLRLFSLSLCDWRFFLSSSTYKINTCLIY